MEIIRYPKTTNNSLKPFNAADELLLDFIKEQDSKNIAIYNDRFGFLGTSLFQKKPTNIILYKSQEKALLLNTKKNNLSSPFITSFFDESPLNFDTILVKTPKSVELFEFILTHLKKRLKPNSIIACGFMTKYFNKSLLSIANRHFDFVEQTQAKKKARLLILKKPKNETEYSCINKLNYKNTVFNQYYGTFSGKNIDYASQFFVENWILKQENTVLDLASGNGFLAWNIQQKNPNASIHLVDDSLLAIESSKLNLSGNNIHFYFNDSLSDFEENYFDLIVSNPPFHLEHETNIEIALTLFEEVKRVLKPSGNFQLVASKHLNFKTHLEKNFKTTIVATNEKFEIYKCIK